MGALIGGGGYGNVYLAYWERRRVAVKKFFLTKRDVHQVDAIQHEIEILENLRDSHIIQFYGSTYHENKLVLIMEYAEGGSLQQAINNRRLVDWPTKIRISQDLLRGLDYIHYKGIIHRDLKSQNVLLTRHMEVKLCDFGLATVKTQSASKSTGSFVGTFRWMAPELFSANPKYSTKSDMYAFGMLMWEMAANCTVPFQKLHDPYAVMAIVKSGEREVLPDDVPADYRKWVEQCWEHDPEKRPEARVMVNSDDDQLHEVQTAMEMVSLTTDSRMGPSPLWHRNGKMTNMLPGQSLQDIPTLLVRATSGDVMAQVTLAAIYEKDTGVHHNEAEALKWYLRAAVQGSTEAQYKAGLHYFDGRGTVINHVEAEYWIRQAAEVGDPRAQYQLGVMYYNGQGITQDMAQAISWYRESADQGNASAQNNLGNMYRNGNGVEQDYVEAISWYRKSADQGNTNALNNLGNMYYNGLGVKRNYVEAMSWYRKSADQGNAVAQYNLGNMYYNGLGVEEDYVEAISWYRKSANQGNANAQYNIGFMYRNGLGVEQDYVEAISWYRKSADQGNADAQLRLGDMYRNGHGVEQDYIEAISWYRKSADQGNVDARFELDQLRSILEHVEGNHNGDATEFSDKGGSSNDEHEDDYGDDDDDDTNIYDGILTQVPESEFDDLLSQDFDFDDPNTTPVPSQALYKKPVKVVDYGRE
ncbi:hypothetical protein BGW41_008070 [Actinomortierella wolfii]|nr:hypothetical protein BGW41_008070 [Actinomortierella wolfii]